MATNPTSDVQALSTIVNVLKPLDAQEQSRILKAVETFLGLSSGYPTAPQVAENSQGLPRLAEDRTASPKEFLRDKMPVTDVERVACLAYYLAHNRDTPHFKTVDISALNTEAAQPKFSNASVAVENARAAGYLVAATKGQKQISAVGEKFVELLPDRDAAREAGRLGRARRPSRKVSGKGSKVRKNADA